MSVPANLEFAPTEPAPLTCQNPRDALRPLVSVTRDPAAMASAAPILKTKTAFGLPPPSRVTVPVFVTAAAAEYRPGVKVTVARSPALVVPPVRAATPSYAATRSKWACAAGLPTRIVPVTTPGGKPVGCAFALTPRSPRRVVCGALGALTV